MGLHLWFVILRFWVCVLYLGSFVCVRYLLPVWVLFGWVCAFVACGLLLAWVSNDLRLVFIVIC